MHPPNHPSFPQPADRSARLWRYMDLHKFEWLLQHRRLYMAATEDLGDPREGSTPSPFYDQWQQRIDNAKTDEERRVAEHNQRFFQWAAKAMRRMYFISCWQMGTYENNIMWGAYTTTPSALAIQTTYERLATVLPPSTYLGVVRYLDYATETFTEWNMFEWIMHKEAVFEGEREVRAIACPPPTEESGLSAFNASFFEWADGGTKFYAPEVNLAELVEEIVLHPDADQVVVERVSGLALQAGLKPPVKSRKARPIVF